MTELKYINKEQNKNLQIKDLITLGLYTILLILLMGVGVGLGTLFTSVVFGGKVYFATYTSVAAALVCGSAYSLIFNKINKNMAIFIMIAIIAYGDFRTCDSWINNIIHSCGTCRIFL